MRFEETDIGGVFIVQSDPGVDARGAFARIHCSREFSAAGIAFTSAQSSLSTNHRKGTVRGLHYQAPPSPEAKLVCCVAGSAFDAVVDLRRASPTYGRATWLTLDARQHTMIHVPEGCAHGFQTLEDETTLLYMISAPYNSASARGLRWDDAALGIPWPLREPVFLSERDRALPLLYQVESEF